MDRRRSRQEWKQIVRDWKRSGLQKEQFAALRGLNAGTLGYWSWTLKHDRATSPAPRVRLLPVHVPSTPLDDARALPELPVERDMQRAVIDLSGGGLRIELPLDADPRWVAELTAAIRAKSC